MKIRYQRELMYIGEVKHTDGIQISNCFDVSWRGYIQMKIRYE